MTAGLSTLSLHATHSHPHPIALVDLIDGVADLAAQLPVPNVVDETATIDGTFTDCSAVITLEAGCQHTAAAAETATDQVRGFLRLTGAVPAANPTFHRLDGVVETSPDATYELRVENFEPVDIGTTYASADGAALVADRPFVPVLMSECGYDRIFGYQATTVGETLETARRSPASHE